MHTNTKFNIFRKIPVWNAPTKY